MRRLLLALMLCLAGAVSTVAQTSFYTDKALQQVNVTGTPTPLTAAIPFASVRVCSLPLTQQQPCLPLATITDINGNPLSNSIGSNFGQTSTDTTGRFTIGCTLGANYQVQVQASASNTPALNYPITCPGVGNNPQLNGATINGKLAATTVVVAGPNPWVDITASPYLAVGDGVTDNSTAIQAAFNAIPTGVAAGGRIFVPCGTFRIKAAYIQWPVNTPIEMFGAGPCSVIQKDSDSTTQSGSPTGLFYSPQAYGQSTTLSSNANRGDQQLSVTSSTGFVAGGWIQINDNTGFTGFNCTTYQSWEPSIASCNLEIQQIDSVAAGVLNLKTSLDNNYTTAGSATVKAITPVYARVHDLKFSAAGPDCSIANACGGRFFDLSMAIESEWHNNIFDVPLAVAIQIHRGKHFKVVDNVFRNGDNTQTQSGLLAIPVFPDESSAYWTIANNNIYKIGQLAVDAQSHHGSVLNNTFHGCGDDCINTHGHQVHDINIKGNVMGGWASSSANATVTGRCVIVSDTDFNVQIEGNTCSTFSTKGIQVESASQGGIFNVQVLGNVVINPVTSTGTFPPNFLTSTAGGIIGISAVRCDNCKVNNNTIYGAFPTSSTGLNLLGLRQSEAIGNHIIQTNTSGPPTGDTGLFLESLAAGNVAHVVVGQNVVTGWHNANCETFNSAGTLDTVTFANNSCFGGPGTNYNYASLPTNFIRDNNEGDLNVFNSGIQVAEAAALSGVASNDVLYPDSTAHRWKMNNNNGGAKTVAQLESDTFTSPTISLLTNGTGVQIFNTTTTCTTGAAVGSTCTTAAISLPVAEADTSYRVVCTAKPTLTAVPVVIATTNSSATQFTITIAALTAVAASAASYDCIAGHN